MSIMRGFRKWVGLFFIGWVLLQGCQGKDLVFDPANETHVIDIYVRTNFFQDFKVFETYRLEGEKALAYSQTILNLEKNAGAWTAFIRKAQAHQRKIAKEYGASKVETEKDSVK